MSIRMGCSHSAADYSPDTPVRFRPIKVAAGGIFRGAYLTEPPPPSTRKWFQRSSSKPAVPNSALPTQPTKICFEFATQDLYDHLEKRPKKKAKWFQERVCPDFLMLVGTDH
jgi:hypothetical protein